MSGISGFVITNNCSPCVVSDPSIVHLITALVKQSDLEDKVSASFQPIDSTFWQHPGEYPRIACVAFAWVDH